MAVHVSQLYVFSDFESLLPPADKAEVAELERSIKEHGFQDALRYWANPPDGKPTLIDGHRRFRFWEKASHLPNEPACEPMAFDSQEAVEEWIIRNQMARRNLKPEARDAFLARLYEREKERSKPPGPAPKTTVKKGSELGATVAPNSADGKAAARVADQTGVSERTVHNAAKRDAERKAAPAAIRNADVKLAEQIESGEVKLSDADLRTLGKMKPAEIREAAKRIRLGEKWKPEKSNGKPKEEQPRPDVSSAAIVKDAIDREVPKPLKASHETAAAIKAEAGKLDAIKRAVIKLSDEPGGEHLPAAEIKQQFKELKGRIVQARYWSECPKCKGKPKAACDRCKGSGFIPFAKRGILSDEEKSWLGV